MSPQSGAGAARGAARRTGLVERAGASAGPDDDLVRVAPLLDRVGRVGELFESDTDRRPFAALRTARKQPAVRSARTISWR